jgi:3-hydroxyacyl-CoA dehydrogenase/enoyl-CoA hydratase/3-hydroxybutyryl-CoA epimerase
MTQTIRPTGRLSTLSTDVVDDILVVTIDAPNAAVNTLSAALAGEFEDVFRRAQDDSLIKGVVLISGKPEGFIAGADIEQFPRLDGRRG